MTSFDIIDSSEASWAPMCPQESADFSTYASSMTPMLDWSPQNICFTRAWNIANQRSWHEEQQPIRHGLSMPSCVTNLPSAPLMAFGPFLDQYCIHGSHESPCSGPPVLEQMRPLPELASSPLFSNVATSYNSAATWGTVSPASTITRSDSSFTTDATILNSFEALDMDEHSPDDAKYYTDPSNMIDNFSTVVHVPQTPSPSPARRHRAAGRQRVASGKKRGPTKKAIKEKMDHIIPHLSELTEVIEITCDNSSDKKYYCTYMNSAGTPCTRVFKRQEHLTRHIDTHFHTKIFHCAIGWKFGGDVCNKSLGRQDNRIQHYVTHITDKRNAHHERSVVYAAIREYAPHELHSSCKAEKQIASIEHQLRNLRPTVGKAKTKPAKATWARSKL